MRGEVELTTQVALLTPDSLGVLLLQHNRTISLKGPRQRPNMFILSENFSMRHTNVGIRETESECVNSKEGPGRVISWALTADGIGSERLYRLLIPSWKLKTSTFLALNSLGKGRRVRNGGGSGMWEEDQEWGKRTSGGEVQKPSWGQQPFLEPSGSSPCSGLRRGSSVGPQGNASQPEPPCPVRSLAFIAALAKACDGNVCSL